MLIFSILLFFLNSSIAYAKVNPAVANCIKQGGKLEKAQLPDGTTHMQCVLYDESSKEVDRCGIWTMFRGKERLCPQFNKKSNETDPQEQEPGLPSHSSDIINETITSEIITNEE